MTSAIIDNSYRIAGVLVCCATLCAFAHLNNYGVSAGAQSTSFNFTNSAKLTSVEADCSQDLHTCAVRHKEILLASTNVTYNTAAQTHRDDSLEKSYSRALYELFVRTNNMRTYHLDLHSYRREAKYAGDPSHVDSSSREHRSRCAQHLRLYEQTMLSFAQHDPRDSSALSSSEMLLADAFGRPESGSLAGNQFWLGSYDTCMAHSYAHDEHDIKSQYCLGVVQFQDWPELDTRAALKVGLCLPETCTSSMFNDDHQMLARVDSMMRTQFAPPYDKLHLKQVYCLPHETSQIRQYNKSTWAFLACVGAFVLLTTLATFIDHYQTKLFDEVQNAIPLPRTWRTIIVESFSLRRNTAYLFATGTSGPKQDIASGQFDQSSMLDTMNGLKCIALLWIITSHTTLVSPITSRNLQSMDEMVSSLLGNAIIGGHLMVDTFSTLSGLLASYFLFREGLHKFRALHWLQLVVHRYWRLTPVYLICYWYSKSLGAYMGRGPFWDYMTADRSPRLNCARESWWDAVLYLSDFKSVKDHCVPFAWFIANGIKFWLITPLLLLAIHKSMKRGYALVAGIVIANVILVVQLTLNSGVDMESVINFKPEAADQMIDKMDESYTRPYARISPYVIGLVVGHLFYLVDSQQLMVKLTDKTRQLLWLGFVATTVTLLFSLRLASNLELDEQAIPLVFSVSMGLIRPLWSVCTCWLVFALATRQAPTLLTNFLSAPIWRSLVKVSFCAYLIQGEVIAFIYFNLTAPSIYSYGEMIYRPIVVSALTVLVSAVMTVLFELPLKGIEEIVIPRRRTRAVASQKVNPAIRDPDSKSAEVSSPKQINDLLFVEKSSPAFMAEDNKSQGAFGSQKTKLA